MYTGPSSGYPDRPPGEEVLILLLLPLLATAFARPPGPVDEDLSPAVAMMVDTAEPPPRASTSCSSQALIDGVQLQERPDLFLRWHEERSWGRPELVEVINEAAEQVAWRLPHADPFVVGDMSQQGGGPLYGHRSHRGGIDADLGLYYGQGQQHLHGFMDLTPAELDPEATWTFIEAMLATGKVDRILLDQGHIRRLRTYVIEAGILSEEEAWRIFPAADEPELWARDGVVQHVSGHRNHLHLRVLCGE